MSEPDDVTIGVFCLPTGLGFKSASVISVFRFKTITVGLFNNLIGGVVGCCGRPEERFADPLFLTDDLTFAVVGRFAFYFNSIVVVPSRYAITVNIVVEVGRSSAGYDTGDFTVSIVGAIEDSNAIRIGQTGKISFVVEDVIGSIAVRVNGVGWKAIGGVDCC